MIRRSRILMSCCRLSRPACSRSRPCRSSVRTQSQLTPRHQTMGKRQRFPSAVVAGAGLVEPAGRETAVATPAAGVVSEVRVKPGDVVQQGDVLFRLDDAILAATLEQRRQDLRAAELRLMQTKGRVAQLRAEMAAAQGAVEAARAERDDARDQVDTGAQLVGGAVSQRELTRRRNVLRSAEGRLDEAIARLAGRRRPLR